ncbi:MFS transporter, partial [Streptomyces sp. NPDC021969]
PGVDGPADASAGVVAEAPVGQRDHAPGVARSSRPDPDRQEPALTDVPDAASADLSAARADASRVARD